MTGGNNSTSMQRHIWMDYARGIAIVLVVFHNVGSTLDQMGLPGGREFAAVEDFLAPFRMPLLMFLSGMLLNRSLAKPTGVYFRGKLAGIGWPYVVWSLVFLAVSGEVTARYLLRIAYDPPTYLWYLWFLLAFYAGAWLLKKWHIPLWVALCIAVALAFVMPDAYRISRFFYLFVFFAAGSLFADNYAALVGHLRRWWVTGACIALALAGAGLSSLGFAVRYEPIYFASVFAAVGLAVRFTPLLPSTIATRALAFVGRNSLVMYVTHRSTMWIAIAILSLFTVNPWIIYPASMIVGLVAGALFVAGEKRSRAIAALFRWPKRTAHPSEKGQPATRT